MELNELIRNLESDFEMLEEVDPDDIDNGELRNFVQELQQLGEEHGFDGETEEYEVKFYAEFVICEEAQNAMEAHRRAQEKLPEYLTREIADDGFMRHARNVECINVEELKI